MTDRKHKHIREITMTHLVPMLLDFMKEDQCVYCSIGFVIDHLNEALHDMAKETDELDQWEEHVRGVVTHLASLSDCMQLEERDVSDLIPDDILTALKMKRHN